MSRLDDVERALGYCANNGFSEEMDWWLLNIAKVALAIVKENGRNSKSGGCDCRSLSDRPCNACELVEKLQVALEYDESECS